jgi:hypothetical protein
LKKLTIPFLKQYKQCITTEQITTPQSDAKDDKHARQANMPGIVTMCHQCSPDISNRHHFRLCYSFYSYLA